MLLWVALLCWSYCCLLLLPLCFSHLFAVRTSLLLVLEETAWLEGVVTDGQIRSITGHYGNDRMLLHSRSVDKCISGIDEHLLDQY